MSSPLTIDSRPDADLFFNFPFRVEGNLLPFLEHWRKVIALDNAHIPAETIRLIEETVRLHPYLLEPFADLSILDGHREFLSALFSLMLPHESVSSAMQSVTFPFLHDQVIAATTPYRRVSDTRLWMFEVFTLSGSKRQLDVRIIYAYKLILKRLYNIDLKVDQPAIYTFTELSTGLHRYYKLNALSQFIDVDCSAPLAQVDELVLQGMMEQGFDLETWARILPPENFLFRGVSLISMVDVTPEEAFARMRYSLLNRDNMDDQSWFTSLEADMRDLFRVQDLHLGVATLQRNGELNFTSANPLWNSLLPRALNNGEDWVQGSLYAEILRTGKTIIIEDLEKYKDGMSPVLLAIQKAGYRNLLVTPLKYQDEIIGLLELASAKPGEINGLSLIKVTEIRTVFANALKFQLDEFENKVGALMLQEFTSIHPAIQWRFREAAIAHLDKKDDGVIDQDIRFENVYPFYGSLDIRSSSLRRTQAITRDLLFTLHDAYRVLSQCHAIGGLDILGELMSDVEKKIEKINSTFSTGDEVSYAEYIRKQVNPVITHLHVHNPALQEATRNYAMSVADSGICIANRTAYEESLALVNHHILICLEEEEEMLQRVYPCFVEKFRTDGLEYSIYTGPSLAPGRPFDPMYLDNLRLRQLMWTSRIVRMLHSLSEPLRALYDRACAATPCNGSIEHSQQSACIEIAPLILAYGNPITLRFRPDEKRLDVDGAYNIRYETLKKRVDKATIADTQQRLTQPGYIAIVYSREEEALMYERHLNYLAKKGEIHDPWEHLDLEPLPGVDGLKAMRAKVM